MKWINVKNKLPEKCEKCLTYSKEQDEIEIREFENGDFFDKNDGINQYGIDYWAKLPNSPKK